LGGRETCRLKFLYNKVEKCKKILYNKLLENRKDKVMLKRIFCIVLCIVLMLPVFSSCSGTDDAYIYFELADKPMKLDPQTADNDVELLIVKNVFEGLLRKDDKGNIVGGAAENFKKDGLTYTFNIREDAKWSNGEDLTAYDFEYGLKRAVDPKTKAPFVSRLFAIKGAKEINSSKANLSALGVKALDDKTLKITLAYDDDHFENTLTTSVAMPCNEVFFLESAGKYGLFDENLISNGSYRLALWRKDPFGIRLYKNKEYTGDFNSKNAAVFFTCDKDETPFQRLEKNSVDMAFIETAQKKQAESAGLKVKEFENICWVMTMSNQFSPNIRKSFSMLVGGEVYSNSLQEGYSVASSIYPSIFGEEKILNGITAYNEEEAKRLYLSEVKNFEDGKFPSDIILYYYDDGFVKNVVTDIVAHWQSNLSAFINIEAVSSPDLLITELQNQTYPFAIFPIRAESRELAEYLKKFGVVYNNQPLDKLQEGILRSNKIIPLMFQNTNIGYSSALENVVTEYGDGYIDFSFIVKHGK